MTQMGRTFHSFKPQKLFERELETNEFFDCKQKSGLQSFLREDTKSLFNWKATIQKRCSAHKDIML